MTTQLRCVIPGRGLRTRGRLAHSTTHTPTDEKRGGAEIAPIERGGPARLSLLARSSSLILAPLRSSSPQPSPRRVLSDDASAGGSGRERCRPTPHDGRRFGQRLRLAVNRLRHRVARRLRRVRMATGGRRAALAAVRQQVARADGPRPGLRLGGGVQVEGSTLCRPGRRVIRRGASGGGGAEPAAGRARAPRNDGPSQPNSATAAEKRIAGRRWSREMGDACARVAHRTLAAIRPRRNPGEA